MVLATPTSSSSSTTTPTARRASPPNGGRPGRKLGIIKARAGRISNALLKRLADDPKVKRIHMIAKPTASIARTAATVGAKNVHAQYGYTGAGVGVAVIDSGITPWHDDLTVRRTAAGQRVAAFVDFVNGRTAAIRRLGPRHARRRHHRRQRLRLNGDAQVDCAEGATSSR